MSHELYISTRDGLQTTMDRTSREISPRENIQFKIETKWNGNGGASMAEFRENGFSGQSLYTQGVGNKFNIALTITT